MENMNYDEFDAAMLRDWLNALIEKRNRSKPLDKFNSHIGTVHTKDEISIKGAEIAADVLGLELFRDKDECYFFYKDVKFIQHNDLLFFPMTQKTGFVFCDSETCAYHRDRICGKESISIEQTAPHYSCGYYPVCKDYKEISEDDGAD